MRFIIIGAFAPHLHFPFFHSQFSIHDPLRVTEMMKNIAVVLSYDGTHYNGWQIQKNGPSIQESMEDAIFHLLKQKFMFPVSDARFRRSCPPVCGKLPRRLHDPDGPSPYALSSFLPEDIAVSGAVEVPEDFDARSTVPKRNTPIICSLPPCGTRSTRGTHIGTIIRWILQKCRKAHSILSASRTLPP